MYKKSKILGIILAGLIMFSAGYLLISDNDSESNNEDNRTITIDQKKQYYSYLLQFIENQEFMKKKNFELKYSMSLPFDNQNLTYLTQVQEGFLSSGLPLSSFITYWTGELGEIETNFQENIKISENNLLLAKKILFKTKNGEGENKLGEVVGGRAIIEENSYISYKFTLENENFENVEQINLDNLKGETGGEWERIYPEKVSPIFDLVTILKQRIREEARSYISQLLIFLPTTEREKRYLNWDEVVVQENNEVKISIKYDNTPPWIMTETITEEENSSREKSDNLDISDMDFRINTQFIENQIVKMEAIGTQKIKIYEDIYKTKFTASFILRGPYEISLRPL